MRNDSRTFARFKMSALLGLLALLAACSSPSVQNPGSLAQLAKPTAPQEYLIQPGDDLDIRFFYNPELNETQRVRPDGRIALQLVGEQDVAGHTPHEVEGQLRQSYEHELKQPEIAVILRGFGSQKAYVDGEVGHPGAVELNGGVTALQAVASTGGVKNTARLDSVIIIRRVDGHPVAVPVNLKAALEGTDFEQDVQLRPYDVVFVPRSQISDVNLFIDQYFRQNVPIPFGFGYTF